MITRQQKEEIIYLSNEIRLAEQAYEGEYSSYFSSKLAKQLATQELEDAQKALDDYLERITE